MVAAPGNTHATVYVFEINVSAGKLTIVMRNTSGTAQDWDSIAQTSLFIVLTSA